jgi:hypothetical protein
MPDYSGASMLSEQEMEEIIKAIKGGADGF